MALISQDEQQYSKILQDSQLAPIYLEKNSTSINVLPASLLGRTESTELWNTYEQLLISCLQTGDDKSAHMCLERLIDRFGPTNERIMALKGLYQEATADNPQTLEKILKDYESTLAQNPVNMASNVKKKLLRTKLTELANC
jgi:ER membrane protein complex subunit 2